MRKVFRHVISESVIIGFGELVILIFWSFFGLRLIIDRFFTWATNQVEYASFWVMEPRVLCLALLMAATVLYTFQMPTAIAYTIKSITEWSKSRRSGV